MFDDTKIENYFLNTHAKFGVFAYQIWYIFPVGVLDRLTGAGTPGVSTYVNGGCEQSEYLRFMLKLYSSRDYGNYSDYKFQKFLTTGGRRPDFGVHKWDFGAQKRRFKMTKRRFCFSTSESR